jgi:hypothetical protein
VASSTKSKHPESDIVIESQQEVDLPGGPASDTETARLILPLTDEQIANIRNGKPA